jgi:tetratricopeptide (TPR) repeat protein
MQKSRLDQLLEMLEKEPKDSFLRYAIATEYVRLNNTEKALEYYLAILRDDENYVGTYYHLGKLYERIQRGGDAESTYKKGMEIARRLGNTHAFAELQQVFNKLMGLDYEDD